MTHQVFEAGNVLLQSGRTCQGAQLAYQTYGTLNAARSNVILFMTPFGANHADIEWMVGPGHALDPQKYFIVIPSLFGSGLSSSPSNAVVEARWVKPGRNGRLSGELSSQTSRRQSTRTMASCAKTSVARVASTACKCKPAASPTVCNEKTMTA